MEIGRKRIIYNYALSMVGKNYRWGGSSPAEGFDCSGFIIEILKAAGILSVGYDHTSQGLFDKLKKYETDSVRFGTLLFYGRDRLHVTHVALGLDSALLIEAGGGGRATLTENDAIKHQAFIRIRPQLYRSDLIAKLHPPYSWELK